jgi:hypothetical protein
MQRRTFLAGLGTVLVGPPTAEAQAPGKVYRIGILGLKAAEPIEARQWQAFRLGLRERGWIEGREHSDRVTLG